MIHDCLTSVMRTRWLLVAAFAAGAAPRSSDAQRVVDLPRANASSTLASNADGFWRVEAPVADSAVLGQHTDLCARTGADACLVVRGGRIVSEWYRRGAAGPLLAMSATKSVTGILALLLAADGRLRLDDPVCRSVPAWCDRGRSDATVRHLLTMTSGLPSVGTDAALWNAADADAFAARVPPTAAPGARWAYSNEGAQLLSPVLGRAAGEPLPQYAARRLFGPLGMRDTRFRTDATGHAYTYANLETTPRDLARLGLLMRQRGRWNGRQLLPAALVDSLVRPSQALQPTYGMLWWRLDDAGAEGYVARGSNATNVYVLPARDLVVVRMQRRPSPGGEHLTYERTALPLLRTLAPPAGARR